MAAKSIILFTACVISFKAIAGQCLGNLNGLSALAAEELALAGNPFAYNNLPIGPMGYQNPGFSPYGLNNVAPTSGGGFAVTSSSPITPTGITVFSENAIEGPLAVSGQLPFLGTVALEGTLPTAGAGAIDYGCGNGNVGIVSEGPAPAPVGPGYGPALGPMPSRGYGPGLPGPGVGYNGLGYSGVY